MQTGREKRETRASLAGESRLASTCGSALATVSLRPLMGTRERWAGTKAVCHQSLSLCDFSFW